MRILSTVLAILFAGISVAPAIALPQLGNLSGFQMEPGMEPGMGQPQEENPFDHNRERITRSRQFYRPGMAGRNGLFNRHAWGRRYGEASGDSNLWGTNNNQQSANLWGRRPQFQRRGYKSMGRMAEGMPYNRNRSAGRIRWQGENQAVASDSRSDRAGSRYEGRYGGGESNKDGSTLWGRSTRRPQPLWGRREYSRSPMGGAGVLRGRMPGGPFTGEPGGYQ